MTGMPSPLNDDTIFMFRLLADEQWHPYDDVKAEIAKKIAPGRAYRRYQGDLEAKRLMKGDPTYDTGLNDDQRIEYGAKRLAQGTISKWASKGIMVHTFEGLKQVRLKPGFWPAGLPKDADETMKGSSGEEEPEPAAEVAAGKATVKKAAEPTVKPDSEASGSPFDPPGVGQDTKAGVEPSEVEPSTPEGVSAPEPRRADFLTRILSQGVTGPIYGPDPAAFHTRPLASLSGGPEKAIKALEEAVPEDLDREDYLRAVEERFPDLVQPEVTPEPVSRVVTNLVRCTECAGLVEDEEAHLSWHEQFVKREDVPESGLWNESREKELRAAIRAELAPILDRFQDAMQGYLDEQFTQLSGLIVRFRSSGQPWSRVDTEQAQKD